MSGPDTRMGLEDDEVAWLRANLGIDPTATRLVNLYQMVVSAPRDQGARGIFSATLDEWRKTRPALAKATP